MVPDFGPLVSAIIGASILAFAFALAWIVTALGASPVFGAVIVVAAFLFAAAAVLDSRDL